MLRGYRRIPGPARRVVTPGGDTISWRQYQNIRVSREQGWQSYSEREAYASGKGKNQNVFDKVVMDLQNRMGLSESKARREAYELFHAPGRLKKRLGWKFDTRKWKY